ncbi:MAG: EamA family transporter [Rhodospirillales bacterium]|nr:EamA family transporter [Rhodospirillales bacterium]
MLVVVFWGVNWPVMKMAIQHVSPLWFAATRIFPGSLFLFGLLAFTLNEILTPGVISGLIPIL